MATPAEEAVLGFADAINRGDRDAAVAYCDPEIEFLSVLAVSGRRYIGHDGIHQYFDDVAQAWAEWRVEVHRAVAAPDGRVAIVMTMHVRGKESGATWSEQTGHVWTLRDGKLRHNEPYRDPDDAWRAVGIQPVTDAPRPVVVPPGQGHRVGNVEFLARSVDTPRFTFGIIEIAPGRELEAHVHVDEDDAFYIIEGEMTFTVGDEEVAAPPGTFVLMPPGLEHGFRNDGERPVRMFNIHAPAGFDRRIGLYDQ